MLQTARQPCLSTLTALLAAALLGAACVRPPAVSVTSAESKPIAQPVHRTEAAATPEPPPAATVEVAIPAPRATANPVDGSTTEIPRGADRAERVEGSAPEAAAADAPIDDGASAPPDGQAATTPGRESAADAVIAGQAPPPPTEACNLPPPQPFTPGRPPSWFNVPLPPAELWDPPGPRRVGLQAGHWLTEQAPSELSRLQHGAQGGGKEEWEVNLDVARRAKALLEAGGIVVDLLPATVPQRYRAHAFVSIHADGDPAGRAQGFKVARPAFSSIPIHDDRLVVALNNRYAAATALARDDGNITIRMRYYYAFNSRRYCHAVAPGVPQAIVETGFLTSAHDRALLLGAPDRVARGVANGVLAFLSGNPRP